MENLKELNQLISNKVKLQKSIKALHTLNFYKNNYQKGIYVDSYDLNFDELEKEFPGIKQKAMQAFSDAFELPLLIRVKDYENEISKYEVLKNDK